MKNKKKIENNTSLADQIFEAIYQMGDSMDWILLPNLYARRFSKDWPRGYYHQTVKRMEKRGLVKTGPKMELSITLKGRKYWRNKKFRNIRIDKPVKWDGCWRLVVFDVPEKNRVARDAFRFKLKQLGFARMQQSVWVHPYDCREALFNIVKVYRVEKYVTLFEGQLAGDDEKIKRIFKL